LLEVALFYNNSTSSLGLSQSICVGVFGIIMTRKKFMTLFFISISKEKLRKIISVETE